LRTQNIYDNQQFFDGYKKLRDNPFSANNIAEKPALFSLIPDLAGKAVLDLGCGYGENCAAFKRLGASRVTGVDISEKMLAVARQENPDMEFIHADMSDLSFMNAQYDVIISSLAVHYLPDFLGFCISVAEKLNQDGLFIFSQEHPLTTAPISGASWTKDNDNNVLHYNLTDYAQSGQRSTTWIVAGVIKYHRTLSDIVNALITAGFVITRMLEPAPTEEAIRRDPSWAKSLHKPDFLLIRARKTEFHRY
jgi:SAM-dependent methyltransferase